MTHILPRTYKQELQWGHGQVKSLMGNWF